VQNLLVKSIIAVAIVVNNLAMTSGGDESGIEGLSAPNNTQAEILMDAVAMPANANLKVNVRHEALKA